MGGFWKSRRYYTGEDVSGLVFKESASVVSKSSGFFVKTVAFETKGTGADDVSGKATKNVFYVNGFLKKNGMVVVGFCEG